MIKRTLVPNKGELGILLVALAYLPGIASADWLTTLQQYGSNIRLGIYMLTGTLGLLPDLVRCQMDDCSLHGRPLAHLHGLPGAGCCVDGCRSHSCHWHSGLGNIRHRRAGLTRSAYGR